MAVRLSAHTVDINAGTLDGVTIGGSVKGAVSTSALIADTADINGGTVDNVIIGGSTPLAGSFTSLNATGGGALTGTWTDLGSVTTVDINGGTIDGTIIGGTTTAAISGTSGTFSGEVQTTGKNFFVNQAGTDVITTGAQIQLGDYSVIKATAPSGSSGGTAFWTYDGSVWDERVRITPVGDMKLTRSSALGASPLDFQLHDTLSSSGWTAGTYLAGISFRTNDASFVGAGVRGRIGWQTQDTSHSRTDFIVQTSPVTAGTMVTQLQIAQDGDATFSGNVLVGATPSSSAAGAFTEAAGRATYSRGAGTGGFAHLTFINGNGTVGTVSTSATATAYNVSSDPRLKSEFTKTSGALAKIVEARDNDLIGEFEFHSDPGVTVWGYNAHKLIDMQSGFGGTEGEGPRDAAIGDEYEPAVLDEEGNEIEPAKTVSPAGVDQSKRVPLLEAAIYELLQRIEALEA